MNKSVITRQRPVTTIEKPWKQLSLLTIEEIEAKND
jgi:hypothetical protein